MGLLASYKNQNSYLIKRLNKKNLKFLSLLNFAIFMILIFTCLIPKKKIKIMHIFEYSLNLSFKTKMGEFASFLQSFSTVFPLLSFFANTLSRARQRCAFSQFLWLKVLLSWYFVVKKHKIVVIFYQIWWINI